MIQNAYSSAEHLAKPNAVLFCGAPQNASLLVETKSGGKY